MIVVPVQPGRYAEIDAEDVAFGVRPDVATAIAAVPERRAYEVTNCRINIGRGGHLVEDDLLAALESGHISSAVLDVLQKEPPPPDHPLLRHPRVMVTPHIAGVTYPETAARRVIEAIRRHRAGKPLDNVVERGRGY